MTFRMKIKIGAKGARPHLWKTGPDPHRHRVYRAWALLKCRCDYRGEEWQLPFQDFERLWTVEQWLRRGLGADDLVLGRKDPTRPWHRDNVVIRTCLENQRAYRQVKQQRGLPRWYRFRGDEHRLKEIPLERLIKNKKKRSNNDNSSS